MYKKNKKSAFVTFFAVSIISMSPAYAEVAPKDSHDYNNGSCIKEEVVRQVTIGSDEYIHFKVKDNWFKYYNYISRADAQAAYKTLLASLLTGNTISAGYGTSSCASSTVSRINLHDS
ncbi:hypothetical protein HEQ60_06070 [Haematospirillum sp. H1815]|uniref:hypothetical protein n=1 Tax=Haematospirillum sp. H1815 TaxID=2723108 RepID=UPI00143BC5AB|nr:hypothetical protein [Haematospirillum sp. H1815]NKD77325.1 hypothetical protein [Haematospirillum sp. H1815]